MPLDASLFMQYAALRDSQNKQLQASIGSGLDSAYKNKALKIEEEKAKASGLDLDKLAVGPLIKMQSGQELDPQETAILKAWDLSETRKLAPDATGNYRKINASIFGGVPNSPSGAAQGFDLGNLAPSVPSVESMPSSFIGGTNDAVSQSPAPAVPLDVSMFQPTGDPAMDAYRAKMFEQNKGMVGDDLPVVPQQDGGFDTSLVAPVNAPITVPPELAGNPNAAQKYMESAATAQATIPLEVAKAGAVEQAKNKITLEQENAKKIIGKEKFDNAVQLYLDRLDELQKRGGINKAGAGVSGIKNYAAGTSLGQEAGRASSDADQAIRDELGSLRNGIKSAVKEATGMSSQEMNSNVELQTFLDSISNPRSTYEANYNMASNLSKLYGSGKVGRKEYGDKQKAPKLEGKKVRQKSTGKTGQIINGKFVPDA